MWILLLGAVTLAAPDGYKVTKTHEDCELSLGPADDEGDVPMRAECHWPDVTLEEFDAAFSKWEDHDRFFGSIKASDVQRSGDDKQLVHQVHVSKGISDREILLWGTKTPVDGGYRWAWTKAEGEPLQAASGNVVAERSDGYWEVTPHPDGGVKVVHELRYDPGGSVPGFLVRWFQGSGFQAVITDLRAWFREHGE